MLRTLGVVLGGLFAGAVVMEVVHKKYPDGLDRLYSKIGGIGSGIKEGFKEGYQSAKKAQEPAEA